MAMYFWAIDRIWRLAKQPSLKNSLMMGLAAGVALVCKHSAAPFLVFALMLFALVHWFVRRKDSVLRVLRPKYWVPSALLAFFIVWGMYFFTIGPLFPAGGEDAQKLTAMLERRHIPVRPVFAVLDHVPAPGYLGGIRDTRAANHNALKTSYFMGRVRYGGDRFFFLVALLVKTPIPFLLLGLTGVFFAVRSLLQREQSYSAAMLVGMTSPFIITSVSHINMGLRHELVVYPFLTLLGAMAVKKLWEKGIVLRSIIILLLVWESVACLAASPEYLTYFNEAASAHADYFLIDSDVDWGQDLKRLPAALDKLSATNVAIAYFGTDDPARVMGKRQWHVMQPDERHGWFVVSDFFLKMHPEEYGWLAQPQYKPVVVGRSLFIFHIQ
jgi:4-amino-4-deoxy-L-arabinose transferase-like glycosyltransferase